MRATSLLKDYTKLSDANLDLRAGAVLTSMTGNANFPVTTPTVAEFGLLKTAYSDALASVYTANRNSIAVKNEARIELLSAMKQLALNVESLAPGDRVKLVSSGFDLASDGESSPPLSAPVQFTIADGMNVGELKFSVKRVPNAVSYVHEYTDEPITENTRWISKASASRTHVFTGLRSGVRIYGRTAAIGRKGQEAYTAILTRVVQ
jgi:hypothetical protein